MVSNGTDFAYYKSRECMTLVLQCQFADTPTFVAGVRPADGILLEYMAIPWRFPFG